MPERQLPNLQAFELITSSGVRVPLSGALLGWSDDIQHRLNEHAILNRSGVIHQSQGQGPRRFTFRCLLRGPSAGADYASIESLLGREPFCQLTHPRFGRVSVVFVGLKVSDDLEQRANGLVIELSLCETGLRELKPDSASGAARESTAAAKEATARAADAPALRPPAAALQAAALAYQDAAEDTGLSQYELAQALAAVQVASEALIAVAGLEVRRYPVVAAARLCYGQALEAFQLAGSVLPPIITRRVPQRMSLARFCAGLYGGGAQALEQEILRLNHVPNPFALEPGRELLLPDPAAVKL